MELNVAYKQFYTGWNKLNTYVGYERPSMFIKASVLKKFMNFPESIVADMITIFILDLVYVIIFFNTAIKTSVLILLSCA